MFKTLVILLFLCIGVPILVPVVACLLQACLWYFVLSQISGIFFSFGFIETTLFVAALSSFAFLLSAICGMSRFLMSHKPFKEYLASCKSDNEQQIALLKAKGQEFNWNSVNRIAQVYAIYLTANILALFLAAHFFPTKLSFEQPTLILYCALISTAVRALYWQILLLIGQYANEHMETVRAKYNLEKQSS